MMGLPFGPLALPWLALSLVFISPFLRVRIFLLSVSAILLTSYERKKMRLTVRRIF